MTWVTLSTSIPRAATSVATRTRTLPFLKSSSARLRCPCDLSPWMASAVNPSILSAALSSSAPSLVLANTMTA